MEIHVPVAKTWQNTLVIQALPHFQLVANCCPVLCSSKPSPEKQVVSSAQLCLVHFELAHKVR